MWPALVKAALETASKSRVPRRTLSSTPNWRCSAWVAASMPPASTPNRSMPSSHGITWSEEPPPESGPLYPPPGDHDPPPNPGIPANPSADGAA